MINRAQWTAFAVLMLSTLVSGCTASTSSQANAVAQQSALQRVTCTASNLSVTPDGAYEDGGTSAVGVWLRVRTKAVAGCAFVARPSVIIDSGFGPDPAIGGTADPDPGIKPGMIVPASTGLRLLVSWTSTCDPNHEAPIVKLMVGPTGDERVALAGARLPAALDRFYCWNNGVVLGTKGFP